MRPRRLDVAFLLAFVLLSGMSNAQRRSVKPRGPRALAVVEFPESGKPRLIPVAILVDGKFYDAGIYKATPEPMALEPGTVYEVARSGEAQGLFVVTRPMQARGHWVAGGDWKPAGAEEAKPKASAAAASSEDDRPPVLRKPGQPRTEQPPASTSGPPPVLQKPAAEPPPQATESKIPNQADEDASRPHLRRNATPGASQLRDSSVEAAQAPAVKNAPLASTTPVLKEELVAISDAEPDQPHNYRFDWLPEERRRLQRTAEALARTALEKYARARTSHMPGQLENVQVRTFNLDFSNTPYVVITASAPALEAKVAASTRKWQPAQAAAPGPQSEAGFRFYVAVVAREGINGNLQPVLQSTTDSTRLDAFSRLELVDAVDADADGRAELLFRETSDLGRAYKLYRIMGEHATELFTGGVVE